MSAPVWLITGAGSGVGRTLAIALASSGAEVLLASRSRARLEDTARWCWAPSLVVPVDLADQRSTGDLATAVHRHLGGRPLAGIVHAAGIMAWSSGATPSGWSLVPQVNAIAPWSLTLALEADLLAAPGARVLFVAGAPFTIRGVVPQIDQWKGEQKGRGLSLALEAAAAKVVMARVLARKWGRNASVFAFHPGFVKSHLADGLPFPVNVLGCLAQPFLATRCKTGEFLALDPQAPGLSGHLVDGTRAIPEEFRSDADEALVSRLV